MKKFSVKLITLVVAMFMLAGCSKKLPAETNPVTTAPTEPSVEVIIDETEPEITEETTEATEPEEEPLVFSTAVVTERVVDNNGQLSVSGTTIVNENGEPIQLRGMSTYGMQGMYGFVNPNTIQTLAEDWGCSIVRFAMYTEGQDDGYTQNPDKYFAQMCEFVDYAIDQGIYCIIDWHILGDGDPMDHYDEAIDFFTRISAIYADSPNVIYEICNEPNGRAAGYDVTWEDHIRPYAVDVVAAIRANDPDNIIIIGTSTWSQDVDIASEHPLEGDNLMYTFHFYAGSHGQDHRDKVQVALDNGLPVFCTEWGTTQDSGKGLVYVEETMEWIEFMNENNISWCNWSIGGSVNETSNALRYVSNLLTPQQKIDGHWPDEFLSDSGYFVRTLILQTEYVPRG